MIARLVLLFLLLPAIEFVLFIQVEKLIDFWPTVGLILVTGVVGGYLARREGASTWKKLNARLQEGGLPGNEIVEGVIILVAGALLVTPGVLTDVIGFLGLLPPTRRMIRRLVVKRFKHKLDAGTMDVHYGGSFGGGFAAGSMSDLDPDDFDPDGFSPDGSGGSKNDPSETPGERPTHWQGSGRQVPGHAEEVDDSSSGSEPRDGV